MLTSKYRYTDDHSCTIHPKRQAAYLIVEVRYVFSSTILACSPISLVGRGETTPRRLRIFANNANIVDFDAADDARPSIDIALQEGQTGVVEYPLRAATFANIHSLSLFFVSLRRQSSPRQLLIMCRATPSARTYREFTS